MNKAHQLFDDQFILKTYRKKILKKLPKMKGIKKIEILAHKKNIWEITYHVVVEYKTHFLTKSGREKIISIFCSAHSSEPRRNVYDGLKFLWSHGFNNRHYLVAPQPLFYSKYFRGTFYIGVKGTDLYYFIREKKPEDIEKIVARTAKWFAKLHKLSVAEAYNFNKDNSRIKTVKPGLKFIFEKIKKEYPELYEKYQAAYNIVNKNETFFLSSTRKRWIVHGDAHPENIIKMSGNKLAIIDFTDLCLSDFARDLGSFLQQLDFKIMHRIGDAAYAEKVKKIFLDNYFKNVKIKINDDLKKRIANYYNWTALRTSTYFLLSHYFNKERAEKLLKKVCADLNIS
jgi:thiamine kinase-like enzyme